MVGGKRGKRELSPFHNEANPLMRVKPTCAGSHPRNALGSLFNIVAMGKNKPGVEEFLLASGYPPHLSQDLNAAPW